MTPLRVSFFVSGKRTETVEICEDCSHAKYVLNPHGLIPPEKHVILQTSTKEEGVIMSNPLFQHSGRMPHLWKIRKKGFRGLTESKGWKLKHEFAEKFIHDELYVQMVQDVQEEYLVVLFTRKRDYSAILSYRNGVEPN